MAPGIVTATALLWAPFHATLLPTAPNKGARSPMAKCVPDRVAVMYLQDCVIALPGSVALTVRRDSVAPAALQRLYGHQGRFLRWAKAATGEACAQRLAPATATKVTGASTARRA